MLLSDYLLQRLEQGGALRPASPLNRQLYELMRQAILRGTWSAGTRLPSSRELAADLGRSRNTVVHAYQQLLAEGYIVGRPGSGTFVSDAWPRPAHRRQESCSHDVPQGQLSRRGQALLRDAGISDSPDGAFALGMSDVAAFPRATWARLVARRWRHPPADLLNYAHGGGFRPLRAALAEHLRMARSVNCDADQIVLTSGIQQSIAIACQMFADVGDRAWIEEPGYRGARALLRASGLEPVPIAVDDEGIAPQPRDLAQPPRLVYTTPSHQFPLGMTMSLARRRMLLEFARDHGIWLIEDDYDSEYRFEGRPLASLQGLDEHGRVLYVGSFSKTLFPAIRIGFLVLPGRLAGACAAGYAGLYRDGQLVQQAALADFMAAGHYSAHIRRTRRLYARKQALLRGCIVRRFGADWPISTHEAGMHLVLHLPEHCDDVDLCGAARAVGIAARPLSRHFIDPARARPGLLLGYAGVAEDAIAPAFDRLADIVDAQSGWIAGHDREIPDVSGRKS